MENILFQEFKDFVNTQPADKPVDNSDAWNKCAIGEFAKFIKYENEFLTSFAGSVCGKYETLFIELDQSEYKDYGSLQEALKLLK